ncbi:MAG: zf-TFIIB domain-containing protein [Gammaproteobacteria bacterium]|nr:zf-TFIIB domain-containing protein [Gammaproteobacteria bacterium]MBU1979633.1 zf-TFIIB domain-containing protein [Gammaproteobacteria bacterium]MCL4470254.1 zf-TFIIB domain-containing protein [Gammaproteobacteria bacterium]
MKCPVCKETNLVMTERQGIEIDYCPECRGVWLDRGELDKFIEHAERQVGDRSRGDSPDRARESERQERHDRDDEYRGKPRKSFLRDLFD